RRRPCRHACPRPPAACARYGKARPKAAAPGRAAAAFAAPPTGARPSRGVNPAARNGRLAVPRPGEIVGWRGAPGAIRDYGGLAVDAPRRTGRARGGGDRLAVERAAHADAPAQPGAGPPARRLVELGDHRHRGLGVGEDALSLLVVGGQLPAP